ncbi:hypothetical protein ABZ896_27285 [Streptomyces sp. NPDC047072]|uniref:hypothetical protein n=1 Tax=Streptomyces sp. NPDC047072 TaxID=3154809 RepID=UPI0033CCB8DB
MGTASPASGTPLFCCTFDTISDTVAAQGSDATVEHALLKQARISIRFGTLNNCLFDAANPAGTIIASLHHDNQLLRTEHDATGTIIPFPAQQRHRSGSELPGPGIRFVGRSILL